MHTPQSNGEGGPETRESTASGASNPGEHAACGLVALLVMGVATLYLYPTLVVATRPLLLLSSTVIVVALLWVWLSVWLSIEIVLEWQTARARTE
ncbi:MULTISPECIES: hypothetical protein [Halomicrobium]|uniref:Uncharacterized protein n=2 Tax=Halomicrobium mukohataei TaxID=57705 RepID=C7P2B0_HALMD|nr:MULTISPECIES: hypothetical protein [Halomicrobium]ACV49225.1 hypothetical protein Hmuk_3120 [Halomicrobium mukohataei DSM 12286]QCD64630.1 hypothetical protein E5139_02845 [Halomicrobium mukohataei]QFR19437.1 hypothetical protein GBQ70_02845 [Halomicrobium sp. ZPS1]